MALDRQASSLDGLHGSGSRFIPLVQIQSDEHMPRIVQVQIFPTTEA